MSLKNKCLIILFLIFIIIGIIIYFGDNDDKKILSDNTLKSKYNAISMMYETESGSGIYEESKSMSWPSDEYAYKFDISENNRGSIMAYMYANGDNTYTVYIQANGKVKLNNDSNGFRNVKLFEGFDFVDTSNVENVKSMFTNCDELEKIDFGSIDFSNVIEMSFWDVIN